jgi:hypothetical protein
MAKKKRVLEAVDRATAVPKKGMKTSTEKVDGTKTQVTATTNSPGYGAAPQAVKTALADWGQSATDMDDNMKKIGPARATLTTLIANQHVLERRWGAKKRAFFSAVNIHADGSKDIVSGLACEVLAAQPIPPQGVPQNIRDRHLKVRGSAGAVWDTTRKPDFMVQICTNPADPATFQEPVHITRSRHTVTGQTPGATLHIRVQTLDSKLPNGKSEYSAWVPIIVGV